MVFIVHGERYVELEDAVDAVIDGIDSKEYDDYLDETHEMVQIAGAEYTPSYVLKEVDPLYYDCSFSDWTDSLRDEITETLECMDCGDSDTVYGVDVEVEDEEEGADDDE